MRKMKMMSLAGLMGIMGKGAIMPETFSGRSGIQLTKIGMKAPHYLMGKSKTKKYASRALRSRVTHTKNNSGRNTKQLRERACA